MPAPISFDVKRFIDWLYDLGPDPSGATRAKLLREYTAWVDAGGILCEEFADEHVSDQEEAS